MCVFYSYITRYRQGHARKSTEKLKKICFLIKFIDFLINQHDGPQKVVLGGKMQNGTIK